MSYSDFNRPVARWRHFTTMTRILVIFPFMFNFGNQTQKRLFAQEGITRRILVVVWRYHAIGLYIQYIFDLWIMIRQQVNATWAFNLFMKCSIVYVILSTCIMFTWSRFQFLPFCAVARVTDWQAAPNTAIMGFLKYRELYNTSVACPGSHWRKRNSIYLPHTLTKVPWLTTISVLLTISAHDTWSRKGYEHWNVWGSVWRICLVDIGSKG